MAKDQKTAAAPPRLQTYPITHGNLLKFYVQGSDAPDGTVGALADVTAAIKAAQSFIFIADWSFQPLTRIEPRVGQASVNDTVGHLLLDATKKAGMLVAVHTWDHTGISTVIGSVGAPDSQNDNGNTVLDKIAAASGFPGKKRPPNLLWRMTSRTGVGFSNHQKFVVLDADPGDGSGRRVIKAFFGGLDLTKGRFDFQESPFVPPPNPQPFGSTLTVGGRFRRVSADDWYNAEFGDDRTLPRQCWQDFYANVVGPSAWDVVREFVGRWNRIAGSLNPLANGPGDTAQPQRAQVRDKFLSLFDKSKFVQSSEDHHGPFTARVVRSMVRAQWGPTVNSDTTPDSEITTDSPTGDGKTTQREFEWVVSGNSEQSIQNSYLNAISHANRFIYIETQYLIGSGDRWGSAARSSVANKVPGAIVDKIVDCIKNGLEFHAYLVIPMFPEGDPLGAATPAQRSFEFNTMRFMAQEVFKAANAKGKDWRDFLSFYFLSRWTATNPIQMVGSRKLRVGINQRYQLYVHSKLMIVDDEYAILGSANLNERSLAGDRDSEICLSMLPDPGKVDDCRKIIGDLRRAAWDRHLAGLSIPDRDSPEKASCARAIQAAGLDNWRDMSQGVRRSQSHLIHFPFDVTATTFKIEQPSRTPALQTQDPFIFDAESFSAGPAANGTIVKDTTWTWDPPLTTFQKALRGAAE